MIDWSKRNIYKVSREVAYVDSIPTDEAEKQSLVAKLRQKIEPWLCAIFQSEHFSTLFGSGLPIAVCKKANINPIEMAKVDFSGRYRDKINVSAEQNASIMGRSDYNFEDQIRVALDLHKGLKIYSSGSHSRLYKEINNKLRSFLNNVLDAERSFYKALQQDASPAQYAFSLLNTFLVSFSSRVASRERCHIFTTNYDRFIEFACDEKSIFTIDRFKGVLSPIYSSSRLDIDYHYNPPGIRGEPRYLEGVVRFTKLHGSVDWRYEKETLRRYALGFGAAENHSDLPQDPSETLMIYPNSAKDIETSFYPYADLFRDFSSAICRPNSSLITYGYGFGDSHINRIIRDMLTVPSTHLVIISYPDVVGRIQKFYDDIGNPAQFTLLIGDHFADLDSLVRNYLPKSAIDRISQRRNELQERRGDFNRGESSPEKDNI